MPTPNMYAMRRPTRTVQTRLIRKRADCVNSLGVPASMWPTFMVLFRRLLLCLAIAAVAGGCAEPSVPRDLRALERASSPNDALACPPGICQAEADLESPRFALPPERLSEIVRQAIAAQERTELVEEIPESAQLVFVQRSALLGFRDTVWIQTIDLAPQSALIVYSRSNLGYWDFGVNRERVETWLAAIELAAIELAATPQ